MGNVGVSARLFSSGGMETFGKVHSAQYTVHRVACLDFGVPCAAVRFPLTVNRA